MKLNVEVNIFWCVDTYCMFMTARWHRQWGSGGYVL